MNGWIVSVKYGETLAFFNCGVQGKGSKDATPFFVHEDMNNDEIAPAGQTLLDMFNIEQQPFIDIFKKFNKGGSGMSPYIVQTTLTNDQKQALQKLIYSGVGHGYWMAHFTKGKFEFYLRIVNKRIQNVKSSDHARCSSPICKFKEK